jgi:hypothetical protein
MSSDLELNPEAIPGGGVPRHHAILVGVNSGSTEESCPYARDVVVMREFLIEMPFPVEM